ncbi:MAG TPA: hypothetical protein VM938_15140 [Acidimicrobiales bacterium]|nr:hypothetical protein [Acidimicrobiales bacterium]
MTERSYSKALALGTHAFVGYTDVGRLLPAATAAGSLVLGLALAVPLMRVGESA